MSEAVNTMAAGLFLVMVIIVGLGGMAVHVIYCVMTNWAAMLIIGLVLPPVGIVHGIGLFIGWWGVWP